MFYGRERFWQLMETMGEFALRKLPMFLFGINFIIVMWMWL